MDYYYLKNKFLSTARQVDERWLDRYLRFILSREVKVEGYGERHHILPRSIFPEHEKDQFNIIRISAREHFLCHWMLWKSIGCEMTYAFNMMLNKYSADFNITSRIYENFRIQFGELHSLRMSGENNPNYGKYGELGPNYGNYKKDNPHWKTPDRSGEKNPMYGRSKELSPTYKRKPWDSGNKSKSHVWKYVDLVYDVWKDNQTFGKLRLYNSVKDIVGLEDITEKICSNMLKHFRDGWIPAEDEIWKQFKEI